MYNPFFGVFSLITATVLGKIAAIFSSVRSALFFNPGIIVFISYNFLAGIRTGNPVSSQIDESHRIILMCHLGNIAWRTGMVLNIDQRKGHIIGDPEAMKYWSREYEPGWELSV